MADKQKKSKAAPQKAAKAPPTKSTNETAVPPPLNINKANEWAQLQQQWAMEKLDVAQAHADKFFNSDEELPLKQHLLLTFIVLFFVVFVLWANWASLDEVTRGEGKIIPSSEIQIIQHQEGGIIDALLIREGEEVKAGQPLMRLRDVGAMSDLGANQQRYLGLKAKIQRLQAQAEGRDTPTFTDDVIKGAPEAVREELEAFRATRGSKDSQVVVLQEQLAQKKQEINELNTRAADLRGVISLSRQEMEMIRPLVERGSAPKVELLQLERAMKERQTELNGLQTALPRAQSAVQEAEARIKELTSGSKADAQTELSTTMIEMSTIEQTLGALQDRQTRTEITSPVNGLIKEIKIHTIGGVVQPGQDILEIVPLNDQLLVEANVRPGDIAFLHPGQKAVVKITAYDFAIYGGLNGELVDISADTITNEKGESFYRVRVRTNETALQRKGEVLPIIPGMVATIDILTGEKTVMQYIMKPLIKTVGNAMKER
ncbi:MAG: HlyD family type I secretion periplasmic adaptor subunit [Alphaproteobacteria bacterium]|nr:HlyD family type I secretion periplasmic adaptor subunit [Alphaproteobacteria bacterium]